MPDDREMINDSYDNYTDDEDDRTFMDKSCDTFRRDEDRYPRRQSGRTWLWIVPGVGAVAPVIVPAGVKSLSAEIRTQCGQKDGFIFTGCEMHDFAIEKITFSSIMKKQRI